MRKIIHIDMDAFFASVEQRDNSGLKGLALAVGGDPKQRGVVATASYEARQFGIHSAMPMATAVRLCPDLIIISPRIAHYRAIAEQIRQIFARFTALVEPLSIDEAYLEVTDNDAFAGSASLLARHILDTITAETQLTASAGVSYCKFLAKYASNINKPNGFYTVTPDKSQALIDNMAVEKFHGIGPATQKKLNALGIYRGQDLRRADIDLLRRELGKTADFYHQLAHGIDNRPIRTHRERKSLGTETTFTEDISDKKQLKTALLKLLDSAWQDLSRQPILPTTLTLKIKYFDFSLQSKSFTQTTPIYSLNSAQVIAQALLKQANPQQPIRLLGVSFSQFKPKHSYPLQRRLFED